MTQPITKPTLLGEPESRVAELRSALDDAATLATDLLDETPESECPIRQMLVQIQHYSSVAREKALKLR